MTVKRWVPILEGGARTEALAVVYKIADAVAAASADPGRDGSLGGGLAGAALFLSWLSAVDGRDRWSVVESMLRDAFDACAADDLASASLYSGVTGVGWAVGRHRRLTGRVLADDPSEAIDEALAELVSTWSWSGDYDLISGLVGVGIYGLSRLPEPAAVPLIEAVMDRLEEGAVAAGPGLTWYTPVEELPFHQRADAPEGLYNLGVAHGVPGAIAFLAQTSAMGLVRERTSRVLEGAVAWLLSQQLGPEAPCAFPSWVGPGIVPRPARSAWCYGDPGVAATLLLTADCTGRADWRDVALVVGAEAAVRPPVEAGVTDAGLCHGASGLAQVFSRLHHATGEHVFSNAARYWLARAMTLWNSSSPAAHSDLAATGFLEGGAGVGLALLAAVSDLEPVWDAALLLSAAY